MVRAVFQPPEIYKPKIRGSSELRLIAHPSTCPPTPVSPVEAENKNNNGVLVRAALIDQAALLERGGHI